MLLLADDALLIHEQIPSSFYYAEGAIFAFYALLSASIAWSLRDHIRQGVGTAFVIGGIFLAGSVVVDPLLSGTSSPAYLLEDGLKLLGAFQWIAVPVLAWHTSIPANPDRARISA